MSITMARLAAIFLLAFLFFPSGAEARQRSNPADQSCNGSWPNAPTCIGVAPSARGLKVVKAMSGFGSAKLVYKPQKHTSLDFRRRPTTITHKHRHDAPSPIVVAEKIGRGVVKAATGAVAYVSGRAMEAFQCVIGKLEAQGYPIKEMGGYANGGHIRHSLHYSGHALDINQLERNVTSPKMPANEIELANSCGLISGAQWRRADSGHFQLGGYDGKTRYASNHHHRRHYASRRLRYASR